MRCPCGSDNGFDRCCGPYLSGEAEPPTAEALMRSRYVAYTRGDIAYIARTTAPELLAGFDAPSARTWAAEATWLGLRVVMTEGGGAEDTVGEVEFVATYRQGGATIAHHERSRFRRTGRGEWKFVAGRAVPPVAVESRSFAASAAEKQPTFASAAQKIGRNDPCACGSGKKFKKCCGATGAG